MALFGSSKKNSKSALGSTKIRPVVVRTKNVAKELLSVAKTHDINVNSLDFNILDVQTYTRVNEANKDVEWKEIAVEELLQIGDDNMILDKNFQIRQIYEVEIFSKSENSLHSQFYIAIGANATKCKIYLSIKEGSEIFYNPRIETDLLLLVNKAKIRANILISIFDDMQENVISKIAAQARIKEHLVYEKSETHLIAEAFEPTPTIDDALILHYDKHEDVDEKERVDYANRGFIQSVHKDELLIEYIKPKIGTPGRNCRGEYMEPKEPKVSNVPTFEVDDTIKVIESDTNIEYRAKENGYIAFEKNTYTIKSEVDIKQISFKTTGSISTGLDSDVSIVVKEADAIKDAVGSGMKVEVSEIEIEGNVGSNAHVKALKASVGGLTHKTAFIEAEELVINVHKGRARGKNVHITRLEHGEVEGDIVDITQAIGGDIKAKEITIELCASHVRATASKIIEIKRMQDGENSFIIDPVLLGESRDIFRKNQKEINRLKVEIKEIKEEIEKYEKLLKDNLVAYNDVKRRLVNYKKLGVKMPSSFVKQYKQYNKMQEHLKTIKNELKTRNEQLDILLTKTSLFQESIFDARVINRDKWVGYNEIIFKLVDPPMEFIYKPQDGSKDKVFALVEISDEEYEIQVVEE